MTECGVRPFALRYARNCVNEIGQLFSATMYTVYYYCTTTNYYSLLFGFIVVVVVVSGSRLYAS